MRGVLKSSNQKVYILVYTIDYIPIGIINANAATNKVTSCFFWLPRETRSASSADGST
jgi:hypothetical protein